MRILGVDPGLAGGLAVLDTDLVVCPMPIYKVGRKRVYDLDTIRHFVAESRADLVCVEAVTRPGVLVGNRWFLVGVAMGLGIHVEQVPAPTWKKQLGLVRGKSESHARFKQRSIDLCHQLFPQTKGAITKSSQDGLAEAALIAAYAREVY